MNDIELLNKLLKGQYVSLSEFNSGAPIENTESQKDKSASAKTAESVNEVLMLHEYLYGDSN